MKIALALAALLLQAASVGPAADPAHLRYERAVVLPAGASGPACAVLDANVFAHSSSRSADDLRLFTDEGAETPFAFTENGPDSAETEAVTVLNRGIRNGAIVFDLAMPHRAYSEVDLQIDAKNFVATAEVTGSNADGSGERKLGTFTLFDLTAQHLARFTSLPLAEANLPLLHVALRFRTPQGAAMTIAPSAITGASAPPSREAQTLYTVIAQTAEITQHDRQTVATIHVPAHVPVERATVVLDPAFHGNFVRELTLSATAHEDEATGEADHETVSGEIERTDIHPPAVLNAAPVHREQLSVDAVLAANLRDSAEVTVTVANGDDQPLPIRAIQLAMRQRKLCFDAASGARYVLRYGDPALHAPVYDLQRLFDTALPSVEANLASEALNPSYQKRADTRPYTERHPEFLWIVLFAVVAILGATALASVRHERIHR
jgi:hypothetical protein